MPARSRAARLLAVVALLAATGVVPSTVVAVQLDAAHGGPQSPPSALDSTQSMADGNTTFHLDVASSGDVEWTITMTVTPPNGSDADLSAIADEYENGNTPYLSTQPFEVAASSVGEATGREMEIAGVDRTGTVDDGTLTLSVTFTWTNFAERVDGELAIRDVFAGETGRWFGAGADGGPGLTDHQTLVIEPPADYDISSVSSAATIRNGMIRWAGPIQFGPGNPFAVFSQPTTVTTTVAPPPSTDGPGNGSDDSGLLVPMAIGFIGLLAVVAYVMTRRDGFDDDTPPASASPGSDGGAGTDDPGSGGEAGGGTDDEAVASEVGTGASSPSTADPDPEPASDPDPAAAGASAAASGDDGIDEELLSDEERVERLLERNGGRMKQANIVTETGWSNAKVSQLLSSMDEDGRIEKLRIGRENLISFPDEDITGDNDAD